jgi:iron complex outermembrane receptor protein
MALEMNNFVGDGNGYVGDPDLKPETAHTLSATFDWHADDRNWQIKATPYYTRVTDFIDAKRCVGSGTMMNSLCGGAANTTLTNKFVHLQYVNETARLYGLDLSGHLSLAKTDVGEFKFKGLLNYTNGKNLDTGEGLYNIMPLNAKLTFAHEYAGWSNGLEVVGVKAKSNVSDVRNEIRTAGYGLVNLRASYSWSQARVDFGIENLFDKFYYLPTGGAYTGQGMTMSTNGIPWGIAVPGMGRSLYAGLTVKF